MESSTFTARWRRQGVMLMFAAVALGIVDGVVRAAYGLPTVLGERITLKHPSGSEPSRPAVDPHFRGMAKLDHHQSASGLRAYADSVLSFMQAKDNNLRTSALLQPMGAPCTHATDCKSDLVCRDGECAACLTTDECLESAPKRQCFSSSSEAFSGPAVDHAVCRHKGLLSPFDESDWITTILTLIVTALSVPTGTGGGGILVPIYIIIGSFSTHAAIPLSKATIFGGAVINNILNLQRRHPYANRPMIGYDLVYVMGPAILTGSVVGVLVNGVCPGWLLGVLIAVLLAFSTWKTAVKSYDIYLKESRSAEAEEKQALLGGGGGAGAEHYSFCKDASLSQPIRNICEAEAGHDLKAIGVLTVTWVVITTTCMLKANAFTFVPIHIPCGGVLFWVIALLPIPFFLLVSWITGNEVTRTYEEKVHLGYRFSEGDLQWTAINVRLYPLMGLFVGVVAGALGLGGGILLAPFILELGVLPLVTVSTTSFFVMFTTSSTSIQYIFLGQLTLDYAAFFSLMGGIGAAVGNIVLNNIATQTKRSWFLVAIMSFLLVVSMVLMTWMSWEDYKRFGIGFRDICEIKS